MKITDNPYPIPSGYLLPASDKYPSMNRTAYIQAFRPRFIFLPLDYLDLAERLAQPDNCIRCFRESEVLPWPSLRKHNQQKRSSFLDLG